MHVPGYPFAGLVYPLDAGAVDTAGLELEFVHGADEAADVMVLHEEDGVWRGC